MAKPYRNIDVDESADNVTNSRCKLFSIHAINVALTPRYLKIYSGVNPTVGSTIPICTYCVPSSGDVTGGGFTITFKEGLVFNHGVSIAATTAVGDSDTGAPSANDLMVNLEIEHY